MSPKLSRYSTRDDVIALVAAANPYPSPAPDRTRRTAVPPASRKLVSKKALVVTCIALAVAAPAYAVRDAIGNLLSLENRGKPADQVNTSLRTMTALREVGLSKNIRVLATEDGYDFFVGRTQSGNLCFSVALHGRDPSVTSCGTTGGFPSPERPVLDFSMFHGSDEGAPVIASHVVGFAADGVERIGIITVNGQTYWTDVKRNVYAFRPPPIGVVRLVGVGADGHLVFEKPV